MKGPPARNDPSAALHSYNKDPKPQRGSPAALVTVDEAKAACKARKRKERQESIGSLQQERKVIRSNSEERPNSRTGTKQSMRRVSSSEDFQKVHNKCNTPPSSGTTHVLVYEDCEHERRRSHERFSKVRGKNKGHRSRKAKQRSKPRFTPDFEEMKSESPNVELLQAKFLQLHRERSPSPIAHHQQAPNLDLSTLHEQVDCSEPTLSSTNREISDDTETLPGLSVASNRLLSSPRNSIIATHRIYLDPDIQQTINKMNPIDLRLEKLNKQINCTKKKIKGLEAEFEAKHGYKLSHVDKLNERSVRKLYMELSKLKKEQKQLMEAPAGVADELLGRNLEETIVEIQKRLSQKRDLTSRPPNMDDMSSEQLHDEKIAVQKALLYLESIHGRPCTKEDRNLARPLYDRYRNLKRMLSKTPNPATELATIHEDETITFIAPSSSSSQLLDEPISDKSSFTNTDSDTDSSLNETLHSLTKFEMIEQQRKILESKKELRRTIKAFEVEVQKKTGRMVQKEDKTAMEHVYVAYKKAKAQLKLLDALVGKL